MERKNLWTTYNKKQLAGVEALSKKYRAFMDKCKTERECVTEYIKIARENGYVELSEKKALKAGDKVYVSFMGKTIAFFHIGKSPVLEGVNVIASHIDSPRIDIKQNPLYENTEFAYLDTHYYGGIKNFHWVSRPLAIHGVVAKKDGSVINICIGEDESDPVFFITDLLIHLSGEQMEKNARKVIAGEDLDILVGSIPLAGEEKNAVAANVKKIIKEKYGFEEEDFISAELELVPAGKSREVGFDRSLIMAYGQDDKVCAFTSFEALMNSKTADKTACVLLFDKEEVGSYGATGAQSVFYADAIAELLEAQGSSRDIDVRRCLVRSKVLSSDVSAGFDPLYPSVFELKNTSFLGKGVTFNKYTGSRGKSGSNDANAEFMADIRRMMDDAGVQFQTAELGRVDVGGGGTVAKFMAQMGMQVIDCGVPVLCMHAPWEIVSKADLYETVRGYEAFIKG